MNENDPTASADANIGKIKSLIEDAFQLSHTGLDEAAVLEFARSEGVLTASVVGPRPATPEELLFIVLGRSAIDRPIDELNAIARRHAIWQLRIEYAIERDGIEFWPVVLDAADDAVNIKRAVEWASGFASCMAIADDDWASMFDDPLAVKAFAPLSPFMEFNGRDPLLKDATVDELLRMRRELLPMLGSAAHAIQRYWSRHSLSKTKRMDGRLGKVGRNEPCPCGSGEKYKRCCLN